jgi:dTDP-4-amino-4,6-dideoxygalactose transaminase
MLLNEFLKEHKKIEGQQASIADLKSTVASLLRCLDVGSGDKVVTVAMTFITSAWAIS